MGSCKLYFDKDDVKSKSVTEKSHRAECDINKIIARAEKTGLMPIATSRGMYGDFTGMDYESMLNKVTSANQAFSSLPASIRKRFNNNPAELLNFLDQAENLDEARELGLLPPIKPDKPVVDQNVSTVNGTAPVAVPVAK